MSNPDIDKIFRSKLEDYQVKPPINAWDTIQQELASKEARAFPFMKVAAGLVLVAVSALILYSMIGSGDISQTSQGQALVEPETPATSETIANVPSESTIASNESQTTSMNNESISDQSEQVATRVLHKDLELLKPLPAKVDIPQINTIVLSKVEVSSMPVNFSPQQEEMLPAVTISYKPGNKSPEDDATSRPEKESTLRKAWDYALSVKNGEERPFNIKEMKNELFASNFKKKKSKTQD